MIGRAIDSCRPLVAVGFIIAATAALHGQSVAPSITTDKEDYQPEETVIATGVSFAPDSAYDVVVVRPNESMVCLCEGVLVDEDGADACWDTVWSDNEGGFILEYQLNGIFGPYEIYVYESPWDGEHGSKPIVAEWSFTDGPGQGGGNPNPVCSSDCAEADSQLAKYNESGGNYVVDGTPDCIKFDLTNGINDVTFTNECNAPITCILVKSSTNFKAIDLGCDGAIQHGEMGSFDNSGLLGPENQLQDISNVQFCTAECTPDPMPEPTPDPMPEPTPDPMPEPTPDPMPEPTPDPMPEPTPDPQPEPTPDPQPEPTPDPMPEPTPEPQPEPTPDPQPEPTPEPTPEPRCTPPQCELLAMDPGPPATITVEVHDPDDGLMSINVLIDTNANVAVPAFVPGTTAPVIVVATKIDQSQKAQVEIQANAIGDCFTRCDPVLLQLESTSSSPFSVTATDIPEAEMWVSLYNGSTGMRNVLVTVNERRTYRMSDLRDHEVRTIKVPCSMQPGPNTMTIRSVEQIDATATLLISDVPPNADQLPVLFRRGDTNSDRLLDLSDAIMILGDIFAGSTELTCRDAADLNDDSSVDLSDAVFLLGHLFAHTHTPVAPFPDCGIDGTTDSLTCESAGCEWIGQ